MVALATRTVDGQTELTPNDERDLELTGYLTFLDPPKPDAASALAVELRKHVQRRRRLAVPQLPADAADPDPANNLLYDIGEVTIPTDNVDEEQLQKPAHWDIGMIRRFMLFLGPISSIFDFATFGIMIWVFNAHAPLFRSGWFVESLATQSLVIFAIRTRRVPFLRSRPSKPLTITTLVVVASGAMLPFSPLAHVLGFTPLPATFFAFLVGMVITYLVLIEIGKQRFYRALPEGRPLARPHPQRPVHHRASRWSITGRAPGAKHPRRPRTRPAQT